MSIQSTPEPNNIFFVWFNQYAGILLKTPSKTLIIDPVDIKAKSIPTLDALLITHEHYDHLDPLLTAEIQKQTNCNVIADAASVKKLQHILPNNKLQKAQPGSEFELGEVTIKAEKSNHPAQAPVTYIITSENQVKVYHTADSLPFPELESIGQKEQFDMVFCTVGIAPGATAKTGFEIARLTKPQLAVPYHTGAIHDQQLFAEFLKKDLRRTACLIPQQNKIYQVSKKQNRM
ncbi:MAG: MBL fold metallo-hydrolase [Nitrososphaerota archaeon]|jgi:L-ascorbate metabolism protein UlaG (beta-lactamase superfamily)|nr:MBL fold metallo-hydrolase [Nitrososphaerota archaeon]